MGCDRGARLSGLWIPSHRAARLPRRPERRLGLVEAIGQAAARAVGRRLPLYSITSSARMHQLAPPVVSRFDTSFASATASASEPDRRLGAAKREALEFQTAKFSFCVSMTRKR